MVGQKIKISCNIIHKFLYLINYNMIYLFMLHMIRILVWEDGFCNFSASSTADINLGNGGDGGSDYPTSSTNYSDQQFQPLHGLQPELFFKMSHEIYNYGEGYLF